MNDALFLSHSHVLQERNSSPNNYLGPTAISALTRKVTDINTSKKILFTQFNYLVKAKNFKTEYIFRFHPFLYEEMIPVR